MDWTSLGKKWRVRFVQVNPTDLDTTMGELADVDITSASISEAYYSDTRIQASIKCLDSAWTRQAWIRVIAEVPDEGYSEELGTFLVTGDDADESNGTWTTTLSCESALYALDLQAAKRPFVVANGAMAKQAMESTLGWCGRDYVDNDAPDHMMGGNVVFETGSSVLERLYDLADRCGIRLDVDGHGRVTLDRYVLPGDRSSSFTIDMKASDSIAMDGISRTSNYLEIPTECIVSYTSGSGDDATEIQGYAENGGRVAIGERGYVVSKVVSLTEMAPETFERADAIARERLDKASNESAEWTLTTEYMPIRIGAVGMLRNHGDPYYGGDQKVMVKTRDIDLKDMTMKLTLKLASANDTDSTTGSDD